MTLVIDAALLKREISLGSVGPVDYLAGSSRFQFKVRSVQYASGKGALREAAVGRRRGAGRAT